MLKSLRFSQITLIIALPAGLAYYGALALWLANDVTISTDINQALGIAAAHPGLFGLAYLLQGLGFMLWALVPIAFAQAFWRHAPGIGPLVALAGGFGFAWRALADFAKAGSMEYLGRVYAQGGPADRAFVEHMANWTQLWTFGATWEFISNGLALGVFTFLAGVLVVAAGRQNLGWSITLVGGVVALSLFSTAIYYLLGVTTGLNLIAAPGSIALGLAPLLLGALAWLADVEAQTLPYAVESVAAPQQTSPDSKDVAAQQPGASDIKLPSVNQAPLKNGKTADSEETTIKDDLDGDSGEE